MSSRTACLLERLDGRYKRQGLLVAILTLAAGLAQTTVVAGLIPFAEELQQSINRVENETAPDVTTAAAILVACIVGAAILANIRIKVTEDWLHGCGHSLAMSAFASALRMPIEGAASEHSGVLSNRILNETRRISAYYLGPWASLISGAFTAVVIFLTMALIEPQLTAFLALTVAIALVATYYFSRNYLRLLGPMRTSAAKARATVVQEALMAAKEVRCYSLSAAFVQALDQEGKALAHHEASMKKVAEYPYAVVQTVVLTAIIGCLVIIADDVNLVSRMGVLLIGAQKVMPEAYRAYRSTALIKTGQAAVDDYLASFNEAPDEANHGKVDFELAREGASIVIRNLAYQYRGQSEPVLEDASLEIPMQGVIGVTGPSGGGKSTLLELVMGLRMPSAGSVTLINSDGSAIGVEPHLYGYVPQKIYLFDSTVAENVAPPTSATAPAKWDPSRLSNLMDTALACAGLGSEGSLLGGLGKAVGEDGLSLSGGQRQRLGIARAIYSRRPILVIDEGLSGVPENVAREIIGNMSRIEHIACILLVTHNRKLIEICDRSLRVDSGQVEWC